ncbi:MAG: fibronectin type III-like domain-contianing protein, partial [Flavisolibacter sp.]
GLALSDSTMKPNEKITVRFTLTNSGKYAGEEIVQLYLRDRVSQPLRPVSELKDFQKVLLRPGESRMVQFTIDKEKLAFYNDHLEWITQPGFFDIMIGASSSDIRLRAAMELR